MLCKHSHDWTVTVSASSPATSLTVVATGHWPIILVSDNCRMTRKLHGSFLLKKHRYDRQSGQVKVGRSFRRGSEVQRFRGSEVQRFRGSGWNLTSSNIPRTDDQGRYIPRLICQHDLLISNGMFQCDAKRAPVYRGSFLFVYGDPEQIRTADLRLDRAACWTATPRGHDVTFPPHTIVYVNTGPTDRQQRYPQISAHVGAIWR
jgi:hypothetical protein